MIAETMSRQIEAQMRLGETRDCTVHALAAACGITYEEAHAHFAALGRKRRRGTYAQMQRAAIERAGWTIVEEVVKPRAKLLRVGDFCRPAGRYYVRVTGHALAVVDGQVVDVAGVTKHRHITTIWRVEPRAGRRKPALLNDL